MIEHESLIFFQEDDDDHTTFVKKNQEIDSKVKMEMIFVSARHRREMETKLIFQYFIIH